MEEENRLPSCMPWHVHSCVHMHARAHTHTQSDDGLHVKNTKKQLQGLCSGIANKRDQEVGRHRWHMALFLMDHVVQFALA